MSDENARELGLIMQETGLNQRQLSIMLGLAATTVNRWFKRDRPDSFDVPTYAVAFGRAWLMLSPKARENLFRICSRKAAAEDAAASEPST